MLAKNKKEGRLEVTLFRRFVGFYFLPKKEKANRFLPLIIAAMAYLTLLGSAAGFAIFNATSKWSSDLAQTLTVQIVHPEVAERERQVAAVISILQNTPGIEEAVEMSDRELLALLEPWLGVGNVTDDLPIPAMVSVRTRSGAAIDTPGLNVRLQQVAPDARLDNHQQWIGQLSSFSNMVQLAVFFSILLILLTTMAIVVFATKSALAAHRDTVEIVHLIGAKDSMISGEFRKLFMLYGFRGGVFGLLAAIITIFTIVYLADRVGGGILPHLNLGITQWLFLISLPLVTAAISLFTADITVRQALGKMV